MQSINLYDRSIQSMEKAKTPAGWQRKLAQYDVTNAGIFSHHRMENDEHTLEFNLNLAATRLKELDIDDVHIERFIEDVVSFLPMKPMGVPDAAYLNENGDLVLQFYERVVCVPKQRVYLAAVGIMTISSDPKNRLHEQRTILAEIPYPENGDRSFDIDEFDPENMCIDQERIDELDLPNYFKAHALQVESETDDCEIVAVAFDMFFRLRRYTQMYEILPAGIPEMDIMTATIQRALDRY